MSKLMNITCDNCGAQYRISSRGEMNCRFCGSKVYLNDKDFKNYLKTRDEMLIKDKFNNDSIMTDGDVIGFYRDYSFKYSFDVDGNILVYDVSAIYNESNKDIYVGASNIIFAFNDEKDYNNYLNNRKITFPSADIKKLEKYLPKVVFNGQTKDGKYIVVLDKDENVYPLEIFNVGLNPRTTAWVISRLENLGCLLEFNNIGMDKLSIEDIFINPKTHELYLYGNWENVTGSTKNYLKSIRSIAKSIPVNAVTPKMYDEFLDSEPENNAYDDFKKWDEVIVKGFGGHNFNKFDYL